MRRSIIPRYTGTLFVALVLAIPNASVVAQAAPLPTRLSDAELWQLNEQFSEPGGYFRSDNFLSNETGFQYIIPDLVHRIKPGGVYLGVGPEQNFTYIVALKPKMAIIFDIRRGNMIEHLMYKALIETSADRGDFLSKLFSRRRPAGLDTADAPQKLFDAYIAAHPDSALYRRNLAAIKAHLTKVRGFVLGDSDSKSLDYIYSAFFTEGPQLTYSFPGGFGFGRGMPTYASLQTLTDSAGKNWAYLATEANFRWLKEFESKNLLVPVVGDFAGPKAIRSVGEYLKAHGAIASVFYTSNVEQYLFQQNDDWAKYYRNVATLPVDSTSTFIRSIGGGFRGWRNGSAQPPGTPTTAGRTRMPGGRLPSVTSSIEGLLRAFDEGKIASYYDVIAMSR
jgi:hypothetical protein